MGKELEERICKSPNMMEHPDYSRFIFIAECGSHLSVNERVCSCEKYNNCKYGNIYEKKYSARMLKKR